MVKSDLQLASRRNVRLRFAFDFPPFECDHAFLSSVLAPKINQALAILPFCTS